MSETTIMMPAELAEPFARAFSARILEIDELPAPRLSGGQRFVDAEWELRQRRILVAADLMRQLRSSAGSTVSVRASAQHMEALATEAPKVVEEFCRDTLAIEATIFSRCELSVFLNAQQIDRRRESARQLWFALFPPAIPAGDQCDTHS